MAFEQSFFLKKNLPVGLETCCSQELGLVPHERKSMQDESFGRTIQLTQPLGQHRHQDIIRD